MKRGESRLNKKKIKMWTASLTQNKGVDIASVNRHSKWRRQNNRNNE